MATRVSDERPLTMVYVTGALAVCLVAQTREPTPNRHTCSRLLPPITNGDGQA